MQNKALLFVLSVSVFLSCMSNPNQPSVQTATIKGKALLAKGRYDQEATSNGIRVEVEGTNLSTTTDDAGSYTLSNVPEGTYTFRFSKQGYGDIRFMSIGIQGGGNAPIYLSDVNRVWHDIDYPRLYKIPPFTSQITSATIKDTVYNGAAYKQVMLVRGSYSGLDHTPKPSDMLQQFAVFYSHNSDVSSQVGKYEFFELWGTGGWYPYDTLHSTFAIPVNLGEYLQHGFKSGDSVYIASYGAGWWGAIPYYDYYDAEHQIGVLTSINQTPSPVVGFKIP